MPVTIDAPPETLADCPVCGGSGTIAHAFRAYAPGCGFSHEDAFEVPCEACRGAGFTLEEVEPDS